MERQGVLSAELPRRKCGRADDGLQPSRPHHGRWPKTPAVALAVR
jgi:hypothetical protein